MNSKKRFHVSGDTFRDAETGLLRPRLLTEAEAISLVVALHSQQEDPELMIADICAIPVGCTVCGRNFGLLIRVADAT